MGGGGRKINNEEKKRAQKRKERNEKESRHTKRTKNRHTKKNGQKSSRRNLSKCGSVNSQSIEHRRPRQRRSPSFSCNFLFLSTSTKSLILALDSRAFYLAFHCLSALTLAVKYAAKKSNKAKRNFGFCTVAPLITPSTLSFALDSRKTALSSGAPFGT